MLFDPNFSFIQYIKLNIQCSNPKYVKYLLISAPSQIEKQLCLYNIN